MPAAACSADLACPQAEQGENVQGRIRGSEAPQSHHGQSVVCLVYNVAGCSQSTLIWLDSSPSHNAYDHAKSLIEFGVEQCLSLT